MNRLMSVIFVTVFLFFGCDNNDNPTKPNEPVSVDDKVIQKIRNAEFPTKQEIEKSFSGIAMKGKNSNISTMSGTYATVLFAPYDSAYFVRQMSDGRYYRPFFVYSETYVIYNGYSGGQNYLTGCFIEHFSADGTKLDETTFIDFSSVPYRYDLVTDYDVIGEVDVTVSFISDFSTVFWSFSTSIEGYDVPIASAYFDSNTKLYLPYIDGYWFASYGSMLSQYDEYEPGDNISISFIPEESVNSIFLIPLYGGDGLCSVYLKVENDYGTFYTSFRKHPVPATQDTLRIPVGITSGSVNGLLIDFTKAGLPGTMSYIYDSLVVRNTTDGITYYDCYQ